MDVLPQLYQTELAFEIMRWSSDLCERLDGVPRISSGGRNLVEPEGFPFLCLLGFECFDTLPQVMKVPTESVRDQSLIRWPNGSVGV